MPKGDRLPRLIKMITVIQNRPGLTAEELAVFAESELHFNICQGKKYYYDQKFELDEPPKEMAIPIARSYATKIA